MILFSVEAHLIFVSIQHFNQQMAPQLLPVDTRKHRRAQTKVKFPALFQCSQIVKLATLERLKWWFFGNDVDLVMIFPKRDVFCQKWPVFTAIS